MANNGQSFINATLDEEYENVCRSMYHFSSHFAETGRVKEDCSKKQWIDKMN